MTFMMRVRRLLGKMKLIMYDAPLANFEFDDMDRHNNRPEKNNVQWAEPDFSIDSLWNDLDRRSCNLSSYERRPDISGRLFNWIGSINYDGRIRERCLRWLIKNYVVGDENRILLRLIDWVPEVQAIAREWVLGNIDKITYNELCSNGRLLLYLSRKKRLRGEPALEALVNRALEVVSALSEREYNTLHPVFRRSLLSISLDRDQALREMILKDRDPYNRLLLLKHENISELLSEEVEVIMSDRSMMMRRNLIYWYIKKGIKPDRCVLVDMAMSQRRGLRDMGRFYLLRYYDEDAYELYKALDDEHAFYAADYAKEADVELFREGLKSGRSEIRLSCVQALCKVDPENLRSLDVEAFLLDNRKVRTAILNFFPQVFSGEEVLGFRDMFAQLGPGGLCLYLKVMRDKGHWHFVNAAFLELMLSVDEQLLSCIREGVRVPVFVKPSAELKSSILQSIAFLRPTSGEHEMCLIENVESILRLLE